MTGLSVKLLQRTKLELLRFSKLPEANQCCILVKRLSYNQQEHVIMIHAKTIHNIALSSSYKGQKCQSAIGRKCSMQLLSLSRLLLSWSLW